MSGLGPEVVFAFCGWPFVSARNTRLTPMNA